MKKKINREQIFEAAVKIGNEKGLLNLEMNDLAAALSIKTPSLYNHISGIEDLYQQLALLALNAIKQSLLLAAVGHEKADGIKAAATAYLAFAQENPALYTAIENPKLKETAEISAGKEEILQIAQRLLVKYHLDKELELHIIRVFRSYLHGFASLNQDGLFQVQIEIEKSFELGIQALLSGFGLD